MNKKEIIVKDSKVLFQILMPLRVGFLAEVDGADVDRGKVSVFLATMQEKGKKIGLCSFIG